MKWILCFSEGKNLLTFSQRLFFIWLEKKKENLRYQDVSSEKWSLPGSSVVVDGAVVVVSSAFNDLKWIAIKISKMRKPFDGKLLSFIAELFLCRRDTRRMNERMSSFMQFQWRIFICKLLFVQYQKPGNGLSSFGCFFSQHRSFSHHWAIINISHSLFSYILVKYSKVEFVSTLMQIFSPFALYVRLSIMFSLFFPLVYGWRHEREKFLEFLQLEK